MTRPRTGVPMRIVLVAAAATLILSPAAGSRPDPGPQSLSRPATDRPGFQIVYATVPGVQDLAARGPDGMRRLTRTARYEGMPTWSPDRRSIAFVAATRGDADIWLMSAAGTRVRRLAGGAAPRSDDLDPAWSPDGRLIAFSSRRTGSAQIYVMNADGTGLRSLTSTQPGVENIQPTFSPDGRFLVFSSTRRPGRFGLFRMRASDGGALRRLTAHGGDLMADYSPDGKRLVFSSYRAGRAALWTIDGNGGELRQLLSHPNRSLAYPRFSRDGGSVLYTALKADEEGIDSRLWIVDRDGTRTGLGRGTEGDW